MRLLDIIISFMGLLVLSPVFLIIVIFIIYTDGKPIIYKQERVGKNLKKFIIYKFRSMKNSESNSKKIEFTKKDDVRITSIGKILRKYSLDELPQLVNVFIGEMSIVGPRPDTIQQMDDYDEDIWKLRHQVRPGITGLAQINGRGNLSPKDRIDYDLEWNKKRSILLYFKIIWRTFSIKLKDSY